MNGLFEMDMISTGLKTISMLLVVLGLVILVLYLMRRALFLGRASKGETIIKSISSLHVSPKERVQVIEISGERFLIGVAPGNISLLARLDNHNGEGLEGDGDRKKNETKR
ncbi:MAG: flagellar biosynthetic protein FliO [Deltaproteobacteria bacterium]|nr:flagellar biosynthetic protein FliO [Deltaproteobacteria bacterium]MBW2139048.1 flagellar biosynthetic protein FliO [Deltaproteobacteria bacterium]